MKVPPMPPQTRERIRRRVIQQATSSRRPRGWVPALVAGTAVATVLAIGLAGSRTLRSGEDGPVVRSSNSPSFPATTVRPTTAPDVITLDRGVPSAAQVNTVKNWCIRYQHTDATVVFARKVLWSPDGGSVRPVIAAVVRTGPDKYRACFHDVSHEVIKRSWHPPPRTDPVRRVAVSGNANVFRIHPSITRLETRLRWPAKGVTTRWARAVIADGIAYGADIGGTPPDAGVPVAEIRAYDAAGRPVPVRPGT